MYILCLSCLVRMDVFTVWKIFVYLIHYSCSTSRTCHCKMYDNSLYKLFWWLTRRMDGLVLTLVDLIIILSYVCIKVSIRSANKCIIGAFFSSLPSSLHPQSSFVGHSRAYRSVSRSVHETGGQPQYRHREPVFIIVSIYLVIVMCVLWNCYVPATYKTASLLFFLPCQSDCYVFLCCDWIWKAYSNKSRGGGGVEIKSVEVIICYWKFYFVNISHFVYCLSLWWFGCQPWSNHPVSFSERCATLRQLSSLCACFFKVLCFVVDA